MINQEDDDLKIQDVLQRLGNIHYPAGPIYTKSCKAKALLNLERNELEAIYYLVESHSPNLRLNAVHCYEKSLHCVYDPTPLNKAYFNFQCSTQTTEDKVNSMLRMVEEFPQEWTIVQLTSELSVEEHLELSLERRHTNPLHLTVFNCGKNQPSPFTVRIDAPHDGISGNVIEIRQEMFSIVNDNVKLLENFKSFCGKNFKHIGEKMAYSEARFLLNNRLENLIKEIQCKWLGPWRCLFVGKFVSADIENIVAQKVDELNTTEKTKNILRCLIKGASYLSISEIKDRLLSMFPFDEQKSIRVTLAKDIQQMLKRYEFTQQKRHPVLLILDEKLDALPWEMLDILENQPISRMPSIHFTYALYKEHESTISNGVKNVTIGKGTYLINPGLDLRSMQNRLNKFFNYWLPDWDGLVGVTPSEDDFKNLLVNSDLFVYSGHGNGSQFFASEKIQKMRIDKVVLLFGCSSVSLTSLGPQVEMFGSYHKYQIACSPCVVGMLWPVTDMDTDLVTTELLSQWLPSKAETHWKLIDKKKWETGGNLVPMKSKTTLSHAEKHEPELLRALCNAKKAARQYLMKGACVARGLPVKIQQ
ncbi:hypothetical protein PPYR_01697 [Photinus pyralis]|uniref:separase n=1 Tax=Photinus pyralis TaxID=7054 RepID=A0A1Y1NF55_PHOPY|nr:separin [Photinus pyralis]KAB0804727.1 hypothetical protein PPYR_01697 [Photinus pyralis]